MVFYCLTPNEDISNEARILLNRIILCVSPEELVTIGIEGYQNENIKFPSSYIPSGKEVSKILSLVREDTSEERIVINASVNILGLIIQVLLRFHGYKVVSVIHDVKPHSGSKYFFTLLYNYIVNIVSDRIIIFNNNTGLFRREKVIHTKLAGFEFENVSWNGSMNLLLFGRLEPYKDYRSAALFWKKYSKVFPGTKLYIVGKGDVSLLRYFDNAQNVVIINEYLNLQELKSIVGKVSYFCLFYKKVTQSGVLLLAQSLGRSSIVSDDTEFEPYLLDGDIVWSNETKCSFQSIQNNTLDSVKIVEEYNIRRNILLRTPLCLNL